MGNSVKTVLSMIAHALTQPLQQCDKGQQLWKKSGVGKNKESAPQTPAHSGSRGGRKQLRRRREHAHCVGGVWHGCIDDDDVKLRAHSRSSETLPHGMCGVSYRQVRVQ